MATPKYLVIDGCPCPYEVAAQIFMVLRKAGMTANSIYRGEDAAAILHAHGKHTQAEIHRMFPDISNPEGRSEHDLHSDGFADPGPIGRALPAWNVGIDSGDNSDASKRRIEQAARSFKGWAVEHPYSRGVEGHHWRFKGPPRPNTPWQRAKIAFVRGMLPRR